MKTILSPSEKLKSILKIKEFKGILYVLADLCNKMSQSYLAECVNIEHISFALTVELCPTGSKGELGKAGHAGFTSLCTSEFVITI